jgi:DNA recombination protein RmuC
MTWLLVSAKNKAQAAVDAEKLSAEQQRVETSTRDLAELQLQFEKLQDEDRSLRKEHTELEVRLEEEKKAALEKQALLERAELRLTDTFKALSAETLKSTQDQFLSLAKNSLKMQQQEAGK